MKKWQGSLLIAVVVVLGLVLAQQLLSNSDGSGSALVDGSSQAGGSEQADGSGSEGGDASSETSTDEIPRSALWEEEGPVVGAVAPDFTLESLDGQTYQLSALKGEKPVLINFWASWCPPCKEEAPDLVRLYGKYRDEMEIYAVNLTASDSVEGAQSFAEHYGYSFPVLLDKMGEVGMEYQAFSIPTSYFIDRTGKIQNKMIGITTPDHLEQMFIDMIASQ